MSAKQFKTLWDADPAAAFQAFIVGLSKLDDEGESAIAVLEEIGIKEVRLRDTLLRATNATELFSNTQVTANRAWQQNTALTAEANKRYATTESKLKNLKNTALLFAQQLGNDLNPTMRSALYSSHIDKPGRFALQGLELPRTTEGAERERVQKLRRQRRRTASNDCECNGTGATYREHFSAHN